jgi:hypothetical protein
MSAGNLHVEARDRDIIVTMPGTSFRVVYRKPDRGHQLVARLDYFQNEQKGPITRAEFLAPRLEGRERQGARAGWIVYRGQMLIFWLGYELLLGIWLSFRAA